MKTYLVGGAVRDALLNLSVTDRDYVVVGTTAEEMLKQGFLAVGKSFPVFLHPQTKEEYALARTEIKTGQGYHGFDCFFDKSVTLAQDLERRDLTINAMAQTDDGSVIDPYGGQQDIKHKVLRHVSDAFREDPVRVLRTARFAAKLGHLGFSVAAQTLSLMYQMVKSGELNTLTPERVWQETHKALQTQSPSIFFSILRQCGALEVILPELDALFGVPATQYFHGEIDTGVHTLMVLDEATQLSESPVIRFAALCHDLGKGLTPINDLPSHPQHGTKGEALIIKLCARLRVANEFKELAILASCQHTAIHKCLKYSPDELISLLYELKSFKKPALLKSILTVCLADAYGRIAKGARDYPQAPFLWQCYEAAAKVGVQPLIAAGAKGREIRLQLQQAQAAAVAAFIKSR